MTERSNGGDGVVSQTSFRTIADLEGRRVATWAGGSADFVLAYALHDAQLSYSDIEKVDVDSPADAERLFNAGNVDAVAIWSPYLDRIARRGNLLRTTGPTQPPDIYGCAFIHSDSSLSESQIQDFYAAWDWGVERLRDLSAEERNALAEWQELTPRELSDVLGGVTIYSVQESADTNPDYGVLVSEVRRQNRRVGLNTSGRRPEMVVDQQHLSRYLSRVALTPSE